MTSQKKSKQNQTLYELLNYFPIKQNMHRCIFVINSMMLTCKNRDRGLFDVQSSLVLIISKNEAWFIIYLLVSLEIKIHHWSKVNSHCRKFLIFLFLIQAVTSGFGLSSTQLEQQHTYEVTMMESFSLRDSRTKPGCNRDRKHMR